MARWFEKYIGQKFEVCGQELEFTGTYLNPDTSNGLPLQYVFEPGNYLADYQEARAILKQKEQK